jgi:hypothetical protein
MPSSMEPRRNFEDILRRSPGRLRGEVPTPVVEKPLRILFVTSAQNSLSQRAYIALTETRAARRRALGLVMFAALLEIVLILPFVDHVADAHPMIHFTQHGFIFAGGVLMGLAIRDVQRASRS